MTGSQSNCGSDHGPPPPSSPTPLNSPNEYRALGQDMDAMDEDALEEANTRSFPPQGDDVDGTISRPPPPSTPHLANDECSAIIPQDMEPEYENDLDQVDAPSSSHPRSSPRVESGADTDTPQTDLTFQQWITTSEAKSFLSLYVRLMKTKESEEVFKLLMDSWTDVRYRVLNSLPQFASQGEQQRLRNMFFKEWDSEVDDNTIPAQSDVQVSDDGMEVDESEVESPVECEQVESSIGASISGQTPARQSKKRSVVSASSQRQGKKAVKGKKKLRIKYPVGLNVMASYRYDDGTYSDYCYAKVTAVHGSKRDLLYSDGHTELSKTLTETNIRYATKEEKESMEKLIWMPSRTVEVEVHSIQRGENPDSFRVWDKDGADYSYVTSELTVDTIHLDWCRANPTVKLDIKETHLDYEGSIKMIQYRGEGKLWSVWNDRDVMHWTEATIVRKFGDEIVCKVLECKANPDVRLDTPGACGKLETSLTLSNSPLISGIDGGSTIDERKFKQASGGYCVLNSVYNSLPESHALSKEDYRELHALGERCSFSTLLNTARARGLRFGAKRYSGEGPLLRLVQRLTSGVYTVQVGEGGHCYTWDVNNKVIIDSDSKHPGPLDISTYDSMNKTLSLLGIKFITLLYQIIPRP